MVLQSGQQVAPGSCSHIRRRRCDRSVLYPVVSNGPWRIGQRFSRNCGGLHGRLVHWALHLYYSTPDADYADQSLADRHEAAFLTTFGPRPDEVEMRRTSSMPVRPVRCSFF